MARSLTRSNAHFRKAVTRLPLGVSSNFRYWGEDKTIYVAAAKGARLRDIDGNEYIDYRMAYGPCILGYADPRVDAAAKAGIEMGGVFALSTEREYAVADRIPMWSSRAATTGCSTPRSGTRRSRTGSLPAAIRHSCPTAPASRAFCAACCTRCR